MITTILFVDTEFTSLEDPELISLGIAASDGREFYAERSSFRRDRCSAFVVAEVLPKLGYAYEAEMSTSELSKRLGDWMDPIAEGVLMVAHDYHVDAQLLLSAVPDRHRNSLDAVDVRWAACDDALTAYFATPGVLRHHALHDARALRHACQSWSRSMIEDVRLVQNELTALDADEQLRFWRTAWPSLGEFYPAQAISENLLGRVLECASEPPRESRRLVGLSQTVAA